MMRAYAGHRAAMWPRNPPQAQPAPPGLNPIRVALIGCGAIAQQMHLPVLAGHEGVHLAALVDRDVQRGGELAAGYGVPTVLADAHELNRDLVDAAIVATPPFHHAPCSIDLMRRGIHVLVEKPMATTYADAVAMAEAADATGTVLSVGVFRRLYPSVRALAAAVRSEILGRPLRFDFEGGSLYNWPAATLGNVKKEWAGGGVLMDMGPHYLDLLLAVFDGPGGVVRYRDNSLGGVETDCEAELQLIHRSQAVSGRIACSRARQLRGTLQIECERGAFELPFSERFRVRMVPRDRQAVDPATGQARELEQWLGWRDEPEGPWYGSFRAAIDDWLDAIQRGTTPQLSGRSALETMRLIDECYTRREAMEEPWVSVGSGRSSVDSGQEAVSGQPGPGASSRTRDNGRRTTAPRRRVLITGATGFIGCRVAEALCLHDGWDVRAVVHNPAHAARLSRLPVEMVQADLRSAEDAARLVDGCDAVVHCAIGTAYGNRREVFAVTVDGTRRLAGAALAAGVRRFVHLSTMAVHDETKRRVIDESTPVEPPRGSEYAESKVQAEKAVLRAAQQGLAAVILRPARVFGPFGHTFIVNPLQAIAQGRFAWRRDPHVPCDMVYVDNLADAIVRALAASEGSVRGEVFAISDGDDMTWYDFYDYLARSLGFSVPATFAAGLEGPERSENTAGVGRWMTSWYRGLKTIATSAEFRSFGRRVVQTDPYGRLPRWVLERFPRFRSRLLKRLGGGDMPIYRQAAAEPAAMFRIASVGSVMSIDKARRVLEYVPPVTRRQAMDLTLDWIRHARIVEH